MSEERILLNGEFIGFRTQQTPYYRELVDIMNTSSSKVITIKKPSSVGPTLLLNSDGGWAGNYPGQLLTLSEESTRKINRVIASLLPRKKKKAFKKTHKL